MNNKILLEYLLLSIHGRDFWLFSNDSSFSVVSLVIMYIPLYSIVFSFGDNTISDPECMETIGLPKLGTIF